MEGIGWRGIEEAFCQRLSPLPAKSLTQLHIIPRITTMRKVIENIVNWTPKFNYRSPPNPLKNEYNNNYKPY
jgi:hypothetical protein